jgi:cold shock CspA family protein
MRGTMLWFNNDKDHGFISTDEGERLYVHGTAFAGGIRPQGRCAGLDVSFEVAEDGEVRQARDCTIVEMAAPRRARMRHGGGRSRSGV